MYGSVPFKSLSDFSNRRSFASHTNQRCPLPRAHFVGHRQAELKRHVKPRGLRGGSIPLDPREIVDRITALRDQVQNFFEAALTARYLKGRSRLEAERTDSRDISEKQLFELLIVWDVEENFSAQPSIFSHAFVSLGEFWASWGTRSLPLFHCPQPASPAPALGGVEHQDSSLFPRWSELVN